ncbi:MAG TPA: hypothetical protein VG755_28760, partial [Nannocystaceae bacterium]|nr:hypothetical protein [Nannocystaceae bacterium]
MRRIVLALALLLAPLSARAWDPSRTHVGITERAVEKSELHSRWMEGSAKQRGWFTPLRVDPTRLRGEERRLLLLAMRHAHADVGSIAGGGPGACPKLPAPPETRERCVDGDIWETTALGWVRIGIALEVAERDRLLHHFVDPDAPGKPRWKARGDASQLHRGRWRRIERRAGGAVAARVGRSGFGGQGTSAIGWLDDRDDPFAPPAMHDHLVRAALSANAADRDRHFALAMVGLGALLHVVQDLGMPAHARGDLAGLLVPLSPELGDRGSPLAEAARLAFGRAGLPEPLALGGRPPEKDEHPSEDLHAVLLGDAKHEGLVQRAAQRFLSDGSLPQPRVIRDDVDAASAAMLVLGEDRAGLLAVEVEGAVLAPWPADAGYLRNGAGRALAAWSRDDDDLVRLYLDRHVLRQQALALLPAAVDASARVLDVLFPAWPEATWDPASDVLELDDDPTLADAELAIVSERGDGTRTVLRRVRLLDDQRSRIRDVTPATLPKDATIVLVLQARRPDGMKIVIERRLEVPAPIEPTPEPTETTPKPTATPPGTLPAPVPGLRRPSFTTTPSSEAPSSEAPSSEAPSTEAPSTETPPEPAPVDPPRTPA